MASFPQELIEEEARRDANIQAGIDLKQTLQAMTDNEILPNINPEATNLLTMRVIRDNKAENDRIFKANETLYNRMLSINEKEHQKNEAWFRKPSLF